MDNEASVNVLFLRLYFTKSLGIFPAISIMMFLINKFFHDNKDIKPLIIISLGVNDVHMASSWLYRCFKESEISQQRNMEMKIYKKVTLQF